MTNAKINNKDKAIGLYLLLGTLFVAFLITCNLIANKFISIPVFFRSEPLIVSAGILPYPVTFLITDLLSEFFGHKKSTWVVLCGLLASLLILGLLKFASAFPAWENSPVNDHYFDTVFGNSRRVIAASMAAYLCAQLVDVKLYDFWKKITKGRYLWIRNNGSTILSQLLDTSLVVLVLFWGTTQQGNIGALVLDGWLFKLLMAIIDTPIIYLLVFLIRKYFRLKPGEELNFKNI